MSRILFIGAHTDDIELSCGGTIARMQEEGHEIWYLAYSDCQSKQLHSECFASMDSLGIANVIIGNFKVREFDRYRQELLESLVKQNEIIKPDKVFTHSANDRHQDHRVVGEESLRAFRDVITLAYTSQINRLLGVDNYHVKLNKQHLDAKLLALSCYASQYGRRYMLPINVLAAARMSGLRGGCEYAESFEVVKIVK